MSNSEVFAPMFFTFFRYYKQQYWKFDRDFMFEKSFFLVIAYIFDGLQLLMKEKLWTKYWAQETKDL